MSTHARVRCVLSIVAAAAIAGVTIGPAAGAAPAGTPSGGGSAHAGVEPARQGVGPLALAAAPAGYPVTGIDVSSHQGNVDWATVAAAGTAFAYVKATEGTTYVNPYFSQQYGGAKAAGLYVGAYAFARPDGNPLTASANFWNQARFAADGKTLPLMVDLEWPYQSGGAYVAPYPCWGLTPAAMVQWIRTFVDDLRARSGRPVLIYTNTNWWNPCTGNSTAFADQHLFIARYASSPGTLPAGWSDWTFWQYSDSGALPGDQNVFNGTRAQLAALAEGRAPEPPPAYPTLRSGSQGANVLALQYLLQQHGATLTADGVFGGGTEAAVRSFQSGAGLAQDGVVGTNTWAALVVTVRQGSSGPAVKALQAQLNAKRMLSLTVDGVFGTGTASAVRGFQGAAGITVDGVVGPTTWRYLLGAPG